MALGKEVFANQHPFKEVLHVFNVLQEVTPVGLVSTQNIFATLGYYL